MSGPLDVGSSPRRFWASHPLDGSDEELFDALARSVPISMIATPDLRVCRVDDAIEATRLDPELAVFDYVPVVDAEGAVIGLFEREVAGEVDGHVRDVMKPLSSTHLISAESGLLSFVETADRFPYALLVSERAIQSIVTLSDLQKLAVRPVLFALITNLELLMASFIRRSCKRDQDWLSLLDSKRRKGIEWKWGMLQAEGMAIDRVTTTDFYDKRVCVVKLKAFADNESADVSLAEIERLRHAVAHAGDYAITPERARKLAKVVRSARSLIAELHVSLRD